MKAVRFSRFGGPEVLELIDVPVPEPAPGLIRVGVRAAGINPIDWKVRQGMMGGELPQPTGREAAGLVDALGEGVSDVAPGDRVFGFAENGGGAAEYTVMKDYAPVPPSLDFAHAAGLPVAVETATRTLDLLGVGAGTTLVVNGAAGAVGSTAVQLALARGARVIGTASLANHDYLRSLGAEPTTYGEGLADRLREVANGPIDAALDTAGGGALPDLIAATGSPGKVVTIADYAGAQATGATLSGGVRTAQYALREIGTLIEAGRFELPVARTYPLERIGEAHAESATGHVRGKLVVLVDWA